MDKVAEIDDEPNPDLPLAGNICAIDKKSVHRICSGQVVLTLATAVKELLENSIDAGATIVDIKLKDYGGESIEVSDNGGGVHENNFQGLTLKHHTSKLEDFSDLVNVETFGFRGEALSSLCALSDMSVITRHKEATVGTRLEFDQNGKITNQQNQARQVGTSVVLHNLFYTLPVRHKEFQRNVKKEFVKMVQVLNSYCIISTNVRITCTNQTGKGNRSTVVSSKGNVSMLDNISNVFGPKQAQNLLAFKKIDPNEEHCTEFGIKNSNSSLFNIEGYVSKCDHGLGRSSTDRQFFFINGRPFDSSKLSKVINEVYHQYNRHQFPFVVLKISVQKDNVDVNVTPDKRQVFLEGEKVIMATVKASLITMYEPTTSVLQYQNPISLSFSTGRKCEGSSEITKLSRHSSLEKPTGLSSLMKLKRSFSSAFSKEEISDKPSPSNSGCHVKQRRLDAFVSKYSSPTKSHRNSGSDSNFIDNHTDSVIILDDLTDDNNKEDSVKNCNAEDETECADNNQDMLSSKTAVHYHDNSFGCRHNIDETGDHKFVSEKISILRNEVNVNKTDEDTEIGTENDNLRVLKGGNSVSNSILYSQGSDTCSPEGATCVRDCSSTQNNLACVQIKLDAISRQCISKYHSIPKNVKCNVPVDSVNDMDCDDGYKNDNNDVTDCGLRTQECAIKLHKVKEHQADDLCHGVDEEAAQIHVGEEDHEALIQCNAKSDEDYTSFKTGDDTVESKADVVDGDCDVAEEEFDCEEVVLRKEKTVSFSMECLKNKWKSKKNKNEDGKFSRTFRATIDPTENSAAEQELQREIKKDMFSQMEILGQFNLGFIITKLDKDLFIVDQHATDEKYNFETLQRDYVIQSQKLICPMNLELTSSNETILMDNIEIFKKNGFEFIIDEEGLPTQRVKLTSTPVSKNWNFGKEDVEEMIFMLTDSPGVTCRPSRVRAMFASRACRKSIMIGTTLKTAEMRKLVCHMGEIEQPWNCPHGRPTMRHLINLDMVPR